MQTNQNTKQFKVGDEKDRRLVVALSHEFLQCEECFQAFTVFAGLNIMGDKRKSVILKSYNAYLGFLHHLYEFYVGCIKRERESLGKIESKKLDLLFLAETEKILNIKREGIKSGNAPKWENNFLYYDIAVPADFGRHFRDFRNKRAHVLIGRVKSDTISLLEFYNKYHKFVYLLYESGRDWWKVADIESVDWKEIEAFNLAVTANHQATSP